MKNKILIPFLAIVLFFTGCTTIKEYFDRNPVQEVVARLAIRTIAYMVVDKNPGLRPYLILASGRIKEPETSHPDSVRQSVLSYLDSLDISEGDKNMLKLSVLDVVDVYAHFYEEYFDELSDSDFYAILTAIASAIEEGALIASTDTPLLGASSDKEGFVVETSKGTVLVE